MKRLAFAILFLFAAAAQAQDAGEEGLSAEIGGKSSELQTFSVRNVRFLDAADESAQAVPIAWITGGRKYRIEVEFDSAPDGAVKVTLVDTLPAKPREIVVKPTSQPKVFRSDPIVSPCACSSDHFPVTATIDDKKAEVDFDPSKTSTICYLEKHIAGLKAIGDSLKSSDLTDAQVKAFVEWADTFKLQYQNRTPAEFGEGEASALVLGLLANFAADEAWGIGSRSAVGGVAAGSIPVGVVMAAMYAAGKKAVLLSGGEWPNIDQNTAFMQWLLDYLENGDTGIDRVGTAQDKMDRVLGFVRQHKALVEQIVGRTPQTEAGGFFTGPNSAANNSKRVLANWLAEKETAIKLLYFLGRYEETMGADRFPRWKIDAPGKYGPGRYSVGYYRKVIKASLVQEIDRLQTRLTDLKKQAGLDPGDCAGPQPGK